MVVKQTPEEIEENVGQISNGPPDQLRELVPIPVRSVIGSVAPACPC